MWMHGPDRETPCEDHGLGQLRCQWHWYLYRINGIMDSAIYKGIMQDVMLPSADYLFDDGNYIFQQDNDPKHTSNLLKGWFPEAGIKV